VITIPAHPERKASAREPGVEGPPRADRGIRRDPSTSLRYARGERIVLCCLLAAACRTAPEAVGGSPNSASGAPSEVLSRFLDAAEAEDFDTAYRMMAGGLRARYTPERLKQDFGREPLAKEKLARARAALKATPSVHDGSVDFPIGDGKAVRLVREDGVFRVMALE